MTNRTRTLRAALGRALRAYWHAYGETAWTLRYGPGYAPTAPVRFSGAAGSPAAAPAYRIAPNTMPDTPPNAAPAGALLGAPAPQPPSGFRRPGRQTPPRRPPAHASA